MAKTKTPFLSLDSHGSIANTLTSQKRGSSTILRSKPVPTYRRTLPQLYQRWLHQDYSYLWTQQSEAIKRQYAADGSRFHLTGYQYWMKYNLTLLPDILGMWHLDDITGNTMYDSSRHLNHGTLSGATPAPGLIDGAYSFDAFNDFIQIPTPSAYQNLTTASWEISIKPNAFDPTKNQACLYGGYYSAPYGPYIAILSTSNSIRFWLRATDSTAATLAPDFTFTPGTYYDTLLTYDATTVRSYVDGILIGSAAFPNKTINHGSLFLAREGPNYYGDGIDHFVLYNRALDATEALRHALRRYP